ncbi:hypothetical protein ATCC90586_002974 [Pythium insidiosum]|nr:hypothetical protein ATCC90586_002974 [Pythium insidiosum]
MNTDYVSANEEAPATVAVTVSSDEPQHKYIGDIRVGAWDAKIFGCFDHLVPNCCMATLLPCVAVAQISHRMNLIPFSHVLIAYLTIWAISNAFSSALVAVLPDALVRFVTFALFIVAVGFPWYLRTMIRKRFQLPGHVVQDILYSLCCCCCSVAQMATHVKSYKPGSCDFGPPDTLPAFE